MSEEHYTLALSLAFVGLELHPSAVTRILQIEPTISRFKGGPTGRFRNDEKRTEVLSKHNIWCLRTLKSANSEFEDHWLQLYSMIEGKEEAFRALKPNADHVRVSIDICALKFVPGIEVPADVLSTLAIFGFRLDYDVIL